MSRASLKIIGFVLLLALSFCVIGTAAIRKNEKTTYGTIQSEITDSLDNEISDDGTGDVFLKAGEAVKSDSELSLLSYLKCDSEADDCEAVVFDKSVPDATLDPLVKNCTSSFVENRMRTWTAILEYNKANVGSEKDITIPTFFAEPYIMKAETRYWAYACRPDSEKTLCEQKVYCSDGAIAKVILDGDSEGNVYLQQYEKAEIAEGTTGKFQHCTDGDCHEHEFVGKMTANDGELMTAADSEDPIVLYELSCTPEFIEDMGEEVVKVETEDSEWISMAKTADDKADLLCYFGENAAGSLSASIAIIVTVCFMVISQLF